MGLALFVALARGAFSAFAVRWSCRVGSDPTPDSRPSVIAFRCSLPGTPEAIRLGLVGVAINHQHRDTPDLDLPYHTKTGIELPHQGHAVGRRSEPCQLVRPRLRGRFK